MRLLLLCREYQMSNHVAVETIGDSLIVRFVRPEIRNPLSVGVLERLHQIVDELPANISKVVFTGTGNVFASGADLREVANVNGIMACGFSLRGQKLMQKIADLPVKTIAAVNGYCFGGALDLALACDERIASPNAEFCHPGVNLGIITGWGGTQRLPRLVGEAMAFEMFMTAKRVGAEEALTMGLIDEIFENPTERATRDQ
jgi:enoyl-CoA hydratase